MDIIKNLDKITLTMAREELPEIEFIDIIDKEKFKQKMLDFFTYHDDGKKFDAIALHDQVNHGISGGGTNLIWTQESLDFLAEHKEAIDSILGCMIDQGIEIKLEPINPLLSLLWTALEYYWSEWLSNMERRRNNEISRQP